VAGVTETAPVPRGGFVNQYVDEPATESRRICSPRKQLRTSPTDGRPRETYLVHELDELEELFELPEGGKPFGALFARPPQAVEVALKLSA
jgi:hypothetical protein